MTTYTIDSENSFTAFASAKEAKGVAEAEQRKGADPVSRAVAGRAAGGNLERALKHFFLDLFVKVSYDLHMASLTAKQIHGQTYYYAAFASASTVSPRSSAKFTSAKSRISSRQPNRATSPLLC